MKKSVAYLDPGRKAVDGVADWLAARARTDAAGAPSLAHLLAVVPTAESGRRLRLALAKRFRGGLVPPQVKMPAHLVAPAADGPAIATRADELTAFWEARGAKGGLDVAAQLADIRRILGANALTFADVAARVGEILTGDLADVEVARWRDLAELEKRYCAALARRGKTDRVEAVRAALARPVPLPGAEEVVVACVLDPLPLLWRALEGAGLPVTELLPPPDDSGFSPLATEQVVPSGTAASESWKIAARFASVKPEEALPALCLADPEMFPEIQGALQAKGLRVHSPSATPLATSSLGQLVAQVAALKRTSSYDVFSAFIRGGDVRRWLCAELKLAEEELTAALAELDRRQAQYLPEKMSDIGPKTRGKLRAVYEFVALQLRKRGLREILQSIFRDRVLDERDPDAREFAAAAEAVNALIDECAAAGAPESVAMELFARRLSEATYALEPDEGDVIRTDGWLELPFLDADELIIAGFAEGRVPESVVGHAFLPDALRRGLGLPDNAARARRDLAILNLALACRAPGAVRVFFHSLDAKGDVLKPSRLLFACADDAALAARVKAFYGIRAGTEESPPPDFPPAWRLRLDIPPAQKELAFTSPSSLDDYQNCPFTYLLNKTFGERLDDRAEELDPSEFGNLVHGALEAWGQGPLKDADDAGAIADELARHVDALLQERFGAEVPAIVALQGESAKRRLAGFAAAQARWRADGWRIVATERRLQVRYGHTTVKGRCDRVDYNDRAGTWCVIDYKTWDAPRPERAAQSLQLPLYCAMLDAESEPPFADAARDRIVAAYCILAKTPAETGFSEPVSGAALPEAEARVRALIARIERGVFWPPAPARAWQWDFAPWIFGSPEESVDPAWIADQERRLAAEEAAAEEGAQ